MLSDAEARDIIERTGYSIVERRDKRTLLYACRSNRRPDRIQLLRVIDDSRGIEVCRAESEPRKGVILHTDGRHRLVRNEEGLLRLQVNHLNEYGESIWKDDRDRDWLFGLVRGFGGNGLFFSVADSVIERFAQPTMEVLKKSLTVRFVAGNPEGDWSYEVFISAHQYPAGILWSEKHAKVFRVQNDGVYGVVREDADHLPLGDRDAIIEQAVLEVVRDRIKQREVAEKMCSDCRHPKHLTRCVVRGVDAGGWDAECGCNSRAEERP